MPPKRPPTNNPVEYTYTATHPPGSSVEHSIPTPPPLSIKTTHIAGILVHIHGLTSLPPNCTRVAVLWLLHPRLQTAACMAPFAAHLISSYYTHHQQQQQRRSSSAAATTADVPATGMIAVSFDQRNHGSRLVDPLANEAWRGGNDRHAQDMFSQFAGTAEDASLLLDYLVAYAFPDGATKIVKNLVLGVSLGAHAVWHLLMRDERFGAAVVVVGCPDYTRLMVDRARLSKRKAWVRGKGEGFVGSEDWPGGLVEAVERRDPAAWFSRCLGRRTAPGEEEWEREMTEEEVRKVRPEMERVFGGKRVLVLSGGADKLVNYRFTEPFLGWVKRAAGKSGWFEDGGLYLKDVVYEGYGHEVPPSMVEEMLPFVNETMDEIQQEHEHQPRRRSKI